jgi:geranylgeranyl diphosphate synthase type II
MDFLKKHLIVLEGALEAYPELQRSPANLYDPIRYILQLGGKRLRPILSLLAAEAVGKPGEVALPQALAVELFHNFSLIHDDIMDVAPIRRGQPTVHMKWDTNAAILSGDAMLVLAYKEVAKCAPEVLPAVLDCFSTTALEVCEGQQFDMNFETQHQVTEADYIEMIRLKTSVLLGCALKIGALAAGASESTAQHLYEFGCNLGISFQIKDDILDLYGDPEKFGKQVGGDILSDKKTIMMIFAHQQEAFRDALAEAKQLENSHKVTHFQQVFDVCGAKAHAEAQMDFYYEKAIAALAAAALQPKGQASFTTFAEYLYNRES